MGRVKPLGRTGTRFASDCRTQRSFFSGMFRDQERLEIKAILNFPLEKERAGNLYNFLEHIKEIFIKDRFDFSSDLNKSNYGRISRLWNKLRGKCEELTEESLQLLKDHPLLNRENVKKRREEMQKECESISFDIEKVASAFLKPLKEESEEETLILSMREITLRDSLDSQKRIIQILETNIKDIRNVECFQEVSERDFSYASLLKVSLSMRKLLASDVL